MVFWGKNPEMIEFQDQYYIYYPYPWHSTNLDKHHWLYSSHHAGVYKASIMLIMTALWGQASVSSLIDHRKETNETTYIIAIIVVLAWKEKWLKCHLPWPCWKLKLYLCLVAIELWTPWSPTNITSPILSIIYDGSWHPKTNMNCKRYRGRPRYVIITVALFWFTVTKQD